MEVRFHLNGRSTVAMRLLRNQPAVYDPGDPRDRHGGAVTDCEGGTFVLGFPQAQAFSRRRVAWPMQARFSSKRPSAVGTSMSSQSKSRVDPRSGTRVHPTWIATHTSLGPRTPEH